MRNLERRIQKLERQGGSDSGAVAFDIRFVDADTMAETSRIVFDENGHQTKYEVAGNGEWRLVDEAA
ncbi:hypothetical protein [Aromatoleum toluclasticum]|uniref:hypothetical protein n=1 Tax=Aromatoleum toluclasticum TaxID=92003 RepID=UPI00036B9F56|nr:hypothetical protein [Aromatoleum toluclasticum]